MGRPRKNNQHLPKYVTIIHGSYWYRAPKKEPVKVCRVGEEDKLYRFLADKFEPSGPVVYMREIFDRYEREVIPGLAPRTQVDYRRIVKKLREVFGDVKPEDIEPMHVGRLLDVPDGKKGKQAANRMVAVLSAVFSKARGKWYLTKADPCKDVERNETHKRDRYVTDEEYKIVYDHASPRMKIAMDLALLTGQRQGDLLDLKWTEVHTIGVPREDWVIHFRQGKTGKKVAVEISPVLEEVLKRARLMVPQLPRNYVLRTEEGLRYTRDGFRTNWQRLMNWAMKHGGLKKRYTFHDLRAKNISDSASLEDAMKRAGHSSMAMTRGVYDRGIRRVKALK